MCMICFKLWILMSCCCFGVKNCNMQEMAGKNKGWAPREARRPPCFVDEAISCMLQFLTPKKQLVRISIIQIKDRNDCNSIKTNVMKLHFTLRMI